MNCTDIGIGSYNCAYNIMLPYLVKDPTDPEREPFSKMVAIDKCLIGEVISLWEQGIKTTGCCCGHGKLMPFIGVKSEYAKKMAELGYKEMDAQGFKNHFTPKTVIAYGKINKGFNWFEQPDEGAES